MAGRSPSGPPGPARGLHTPARLAALRTNLAQHGWARRRQAAHLAAAQAWAARDDAFLRALVIPPEVPRAYDVHQLGCPIHGAAANANGLYQWQYSLDRPFRIRCPAGDEEYPSNDYAAFLASGRRDRSLLTGEHADDGWGWGSATQPHRYWFVAYYAHWSMQRELRQALNELAVGVVVSQEEDLARRLAHRAALLLWQLAVHYPDYDYRTQARESREHNPDYTGRITNMIWEVDWADAGARAYDAVRPYLAADEALQRTAGLDGPGLDGFIRQRLLLTMARDITSGNGRNRGNYGAHQQALVRLALALDERQGPPTTAEMIQWVLANPRPVNPADMGLVEALENLVYRDGMPPESPAYNYIWSNGVAGVLEALGECGRGISGQPRCRRLMRWHEGTLVAAGPPGSARLQPPLGDSGDLFARPGTPGPAMLRLALAQGSDPRRLADRHARSCEEEEDLFAEPLAELAARAPAGAAEAGEDLRPASHLLPAYGLARLQCGASASPTAAVLHYGSWSNHMHRDQLSLLLFAHGNLLLCDVGYPEQTDAYNHRRYGIWSNTIAHNTVTVDARAQGRGPGRLHACSLGGFAQVVDAACGSYPHLSLYRRAVILVQAAPARAYVFDVFHVRGGGQHDWALMGPPGDFTCSEPLGPVQEQGTLAGPQVPYECFYDDPERGGRPLGSTPMSGYAGSGFQFLVHVQRAALRGQAVATWRLAAPLAGQPPRPWQGIGVRSHLVGTDEELLAADCQPQRYRHLPPWVKHLIRRRRGPGLRSVFASVHEPFCGEPWIASVSAAPLQPDDGDAVALRLRLRSGETHYLFHSLLPGRSYAVDGRLEVDGQAACVVLDGGGRARRALHLNGRRLRCGALELASAGLRRSRITAVDYPRGALELEDPVVGADLAPGQILLIQNPGGCESVTFRQRLSATALSVGDEDLAVAGGPVQEVLPASRRLVTGVTCPHAYPGLTVLNGRGQVQGRVAPGDRLTVARPEGAPPLAREDFPPGGDGQGARFAVVVAGPGDTVVLPSLALFEA